MNKFLKSFLIAVVVIFLICYLAGGFYELRVDPSKWSQETRGFVVSFWAMFSAIIAMVLYLGQD
jgi:hypothetical protein